MEETHSGESILSTRLLVLQPASQLAIHTSALPLTKTLSAQNSQDSRWQQVWTTKPHDSVRQNVFRDISNNVPIEFDQARLIELTAFWFRRVIGWLGVCVYRTGRPNSMMTKFHTVLRLYLYACYKTADVVDRPRTACCRKWLASNLAWWQFRQ